ncbi:CBO2463/CBO2479 domain-containing protein [Gemella morbillorum]
MDYIINPVAMGGIVKEIKDNNVKIHLHGRLGVITVDKKLIKFEDVLEMGHVLEFYFSYIQVMEDPYDYDSSDILYEEMQPCLLGGKITQVNDTAIEVNIMDKLGTIAVPRRWAFTSIELKENLDVEFYLSHMKVIGKKDIMINRV